MNVPAIRAWLMLQPRPKTIRVTSEGASPQKIEIDDGTRWVQVAQSLGALQPELIECLALDGSVIRAMRPAELDEEEPEEDDGADVVVQDPESARLIIFARLIAEAYRHSTDVAFDKMIAMFEASVRRGESLEKSLETTNKILMKTAADQIQQQVEGAPGGGGSSLIEQLISTFVQAKAQGQAERGPPAATNGAAKPEATS